MAELAFDLALWPGTLPASCQPTALSLTTTALYLGCHSGRIYVLHPDSLLPQMVMCSAAGMPIIGFGFGRHQVDQPASLTPVLVSLDTDGNLCSWGVQDGRCLMHNYTGLSPLSAIALEDHLVIICQPDSADSNALYIYQLTSLELSQSLELPGRIDRVIQDHGTLYCRLANGAVYSLPFDAALGRVTAEPFEIASGVSKMYMCKGHRAFLRTTGEFLIGDIPVRDAPRDIKDVFLLSPDLLILWAGKNLYSYDGYAFEVLRECTCISAVHRADGVIQIVDGLELIEITASKVTLSRTIPNAPRTMTAAFATGEELAIGTCDGRVQLTNLEDFVAHSGEPLMYGVVQPHAVSSLLTTDRLVIAGTASGRLTFYDRTSQERLVAFRNHCCAIRHLFIIRKDSDELVCVAQDSSVSIYRLGEAVEHVGVILPCDVRQLARVKWATPYDEFISLEYGDGHIAVWNMKSRSSEDLDPGNDLLKLFTSEHKLIWESPTLIPSIPFDIRQVAGGPLPSALAHAVNHTLPDGLCFGFHGAGQNISYVSPKMEPMKLSPHISAILRLACLALSEDPDSYHGDDDSAFCLPSISSLSKYWIDPDPRVQEAARLLISRVIDQLPEPVLRGFIGYWLHYLPNYSAKSMNRAAIILGILALKDPELLEEKARKAVVESLLTQLGGDKRNLFRTAAIEMLGLGFPVWRAHFAPTPVFKALFTWLVSINHYDCAVGGPVPTLQADAVEIDAKLHSSIVATERTLIQMLRWEKYAILPFWLNDLLFTKSANERLCGLAILSEILADHPETLEEYLQLVLDHLVRMLDPSNSPMRQASAPMILAVISEIVQVFPTVRLHKGSQKLLVASKHDVTITLFDLRTGMKVCSFEGLSKPASASAFSSDGKHIAVYSFDEATLRFWAVPSGIMSLLGTTHKPSRPPLVVDPQVTESFLAWRRVELAWESEKILHFLFPDDTSVEISI